VTVATSLSGTDCSAVLFDAFREKLDGEVAVFLTVLWFRSLASSTCRDSRSFVLLLFFLISPNKGINNLRRQDNGCEYGYLSLRLN
jgi:hypothetical protein